MKDGPVLERMAYLHLDSRKKNAMKIRVSGSAENWHRGIMGMVNITDNVSMTHSNETADAAYAAHDLSESQRLRIRHWHTW